MTNHIDHTHPSTKAARALCRRMALTDGAPLEAFAPTVSAPYSWPACSTCGQPADPWGDHRREGCKASPFLDLPTHLMPVRLLHADLATKARFTTWVQGFARPTAYAVKGSFASSVR